MNVTNKIFPHPVLGIEDSVTGSYSINLEAESDGEIIKFRVFHSLLNNELEKLIEQKNTRFVSHVLCKATLYRKAFVSEIPSQIITISSEKLRDAVELDFFICAETPIKYNNPDAHPDFSGISFPMERADILGYGGRGIFHANKAHEKLESVAALMTINSQTNSKYMYLHYDGDKIILLLPREEYEIYQEVKNISSVNILHSSIVLPALIEALTFLESREASEYSHYRWHRLLSQHKEQSKESDNLRIAQKILESPLNRALSTLENIFNDGI